MFVPFAILMMPLVKQTSQMGIGNRVGVIVLYVVFYMPMNLLLYSGYLKNIPMALEEAAKVDGATGWQVITRIQLPLCRNAIGTSMICSITARVAMYEQIALTTAGGPGDDTMSLPIILVKSIQDMKYGYANANGVIMFILGLITLAVINKAFRMNESVY